MIDKQALESYLREVSGFSVPLAGNLRSMVRRLQDDNEHKLGLIRLFKAEAAAMREALEEIKEEAETDLDRDIILTACQSAPGGDGGREPLQAEAAAMREALHPLAALYHTRLDDLNDDAPLYQHCDGLITVGDVRRAKDALADDVGRKMLAEAAAMREALEHSTSALKYVADELRALGEDGDADMMERQAQENRVALADDVGREMLERLRQAKQECDQWRTTCEVLSAIDAVKVAMLEEEL